MAAIQADASAIEATSSVLRLGRLLGLKGLTIKNSQRSGLHPTRSAEVIFRGRTLGEVGEVDPGVLDAYGITGRTAWIQLDTGPITAALANSPKYRKVSRLPSSDIDLAFVVPEDIAVSGVVTTLEKAGGKLLQSVRFLNAFRSEQLGEGVRSLAFTLKFQAMDRTLTDAEVSDLRATLIDAVANKNGGQLRQ